PEGRPRPGARRGAQRGERLRRVPVGGAARPTRVPAVSAVITGLGVVSPGGIGAAEHWRSTLAGELRVGPIETFDASRYGTAVAGQVPGFRSADHLDDRLAVQTDRWTWMSLAAARM